MITKRIYLCDNNIDGIFTAIYVAWSSKYGHANIKIEEISEESNYSNIELFSEYIAVNNDIDLSTKVAASIRKKISEEAYEMVCRVALSDYVGKADLIYRFLILGFSIGCSITEHLSNETVNQVFKINKYVSREAYHFIEFIRFSEQDNGLLTAVIHPNNNVLTLITPHFADRFPLERFLIFDENHKIASLHIPGNPWILAAIPNIYEESTKQLSFDEDEYRDLWKIFYHNIAIKERINPKLQRNNLPLRFRQDMTEFND
jgi:probable DNA metabolism protein